MFRTRLFWFRKDEGDFADREHKSESAARSFAEMRSAQVAGGVYVLRGESVIGWYADGVDTMIAV